MHFFLATARQGMLIVELLDFHEGNCICLVVLLLACEKRFTLKINSKGYR